jgi:hypothetical protein
MPDEHSLTLRQADQARTDFAAIEDELDFVKEQASRLLTAVRGEFASVLTNWDLSSMYLRNWHQLDKEFLGSL